MEEKLLVQAAREGHRDAYASLVALHSRAVFGLCVGILCNHHDAEDVAQEAFVKAFLQMDGLRSDDRFLPWIAAIARNLCLDFKRREKRTNATRAARPPCESETPPHEAQVVERESRERLQRTIARLPEKYRMPLMLYYFDGRRTESVAEALGLDPAGVATRLSRARRMLRQLLEEQEGER